MAESPSDRISNRTSPLPRNVRLLGLASLLNDVASEMVFPLLPLFLTSSKFLSGSRFALGMIEGLADSTSSLVKLWSGGRSDRAGSRKGFVVLGYALAAVARPIIGLTSAPWQLFGLRMGDRIGKGIRTSPRDALIADSIDPAMRGRAFGFHRGMDHLGAAVGPILAAGFLWFWPGELRILFLLTLLPGLLVVVLLWLGLKEAPSPPTPLPEGEGRNNPTAKPRRPTFTLKPFDRRFRIYLVALMIFTLGNSSDAFLLVRAGELGVTTPLLPILWCVFHVAKSTGNLVAGRSVNRFGPRAMILAGWLLYAAVYLLFGAACEAWHAWALFLAYALFYSVTEPAEKTLVANLVGPEHRGLAYGWFNLAIGITTLPASAAFGWLYQGWGPLVAFGFGAGLALAAAVVLLGTGRK